MRQQDKTTSILALSRVITGYLLPYGHNLITRLITWFCPTLQQRFVHIVYLWHFQKWLLLKHAPALPWTSWICITLAKMMCIQMCCIFLIFQGLGTVPHSWKSLQKRVTGGYCCICMRWYFRHITSFITLPSPCGAFLFSSLFPRAIKIHIYRNLSNLTAR